MTEFLRQPAEIKFADEIEILKRYDNRDKPSNWVLSPKAVQIYITGGRLQSGDIISRKYMGDIRLIQTAIATLMTDRGLLLYGAPGTAKSMLSEQLAAAINGNSRLIVQGTAGTTDQELKYSWNYASLLSKGPTLEALVPSPVMKAMQSGQIARIEELTRIPADVQDTLISTLSEKEISIAELETIVSAQTGFSIIATANDKDKGVNKFSSALERRFNTVILPLPSSFEEEVAIVKKRVSDFQSNMQLAEIPNAIEEIEKVVTIFRELRSGVSVDKKRKIKQTTGTLSPAEAISVINNSMVMAVSFGDGRISSKDLAVSLLGAVVKDTGKDTTAWKEYTETVMKGRSRWSDLYKACKTL